ncbi:MAG: hypothetical protein JO219_05415 [Candidatus Eremiobacteraeota bacterium]|nr:hypothetical protein [Candidatus Eremiobacteraeota bacterium]MBV8365372.1 hypothetical protein [Candidatus Eremiobacteraeota bacterium]
MSHRAFTIALARALAIALLSAAVICAGVSNASAATTIADVSPAPAATAQPKDTKLHAWLTPYVWLPGIHGTLNFTVPTTGGPAAFSVTPSQYVPKLASGALFTGGVQKGDWGAFTDLIYLNLTGISEGVSTISGPGGIVNIPINTNVQGRFTSTLWTTALSYNLAPNSPPENFDAILGFRYANFNPQVSWNFSGPLGLLPASGSHSETLTMFDAIGGVKGKFDLDKHWFAPFYGDIGTGGQNFTWQALGGIGYGFHSGAWTLVYRNLYYNMTNGGLVHNTNLEGLALGYTFKF